MTVRQANYSKQRIDPLFHGFRRRTNQSVHHRIRKHDGVLFKKCKLRYGFLVKQLKEPSELKSTYRFNFFIIHTKYNRIYRVQTFYSLHIYSSFTYIVLNGL